MITKMLQEKLNKIFIKTITDNNYDNEVDRFNDINELIKFGVDINYRDTDDWTALMIVCWDGRTEIVKLLLDKGAKVDLRYNGQTALDIAKEKLAFWKTSNFQEHIANLEKIIKLLTK